MHLRAVVSILRRSLLLVFFIFLSTIAGAQISHDFIRENAIEVTSVEDEKSDTLYEKLKDFRLIMIGERHGTNEPAEFVEHLSKVMVHHGKKVALGLEIPRDEMEAFIAAPSEENLRKTAFFSKNNVDGRNAQAWFDLILDCYQDTNILLFYFDNLEGRIMKLRSSAMYLSLLEVKKEFPDYTFITIMGNVHNRLRPFSGIETMGSLCAKDTLNFKQGDICSIVHLFGGGTALKDRGSGFQLEEVKFKENHYSEATKFDHFFILDVEQYFKFYTSLYYSRTITASESIRLK